MNEKDVRKKLNDFRSGKMDAFKGLLRNVSSREQPSEPITRPMRIIANANYH